MRSRDGQLGLFVGSVTEAIAERDRAIERVARPAAEWIETVIGFIREFAPGTEFSSDSLWFHLREAGIPSPREPRAMGAALKRAASMDLIKPTGVYQRSERSECHARPVALWLRK